MPAAGSQTSYCRSTQDHSSSGSWHDFTMDCRLPSVRGYSPYDSTCCCSIVALHPCCKKEDIFVLSFGSIISLIFSRGLVATVEFLLACFYVSRSGSLNFSNCSAALGEPEREPKREPEINADAMDAMMPLQPATSELTRESAVKRKLSAVCLSEEAHALCF